MAAGGCSARKRNARGSAGKKGERLRDDEPLNAARRAAAPAQEKNRGGRKSGGGSVDTTSPDLAKTWSLISSERSRPEFVKSMAVEQTAQQPVWQPGFEWEAPPQQDPTVTERLDLDSIGRDADFNVTAAAPSTLCTTLNDVPEFIPGWHA